MENIKAPARITYTPNQNLAYLGEVYKQIAPGMVRTLTETYPREVAEEAVQEAFLIFLGPNRATLAEDKTPHQQFCFAMQQARWQLHEKSRRQHPDLSLEKMQEDEQKRGISHEIDRSIPDPAEEIAKRMDQECIMRKVEGELNPKDWAILVFKYALGLSSAEIEERIHISAHAIDTRGWKAKNKVRQAIKDSNLIGEAS